MKKLKWISVIIAAFVIFAIASVGNNKKEAENSSVSTETIAVETFAGNTEKEIESQDVGMQLAIPDYSGQAVIEVNGDDPFFTDEERIYSGTYISLSELDGLGRCGVAKACVGSETRTYEDRGDISHIYPSGWKQHKLSDGSYLYNRSHLLMYALTGLNDDERNLITGTRQFNASTDKGMLAYENQVLWVVDNFNAHVLYRVTPYYDGNNLVAKGVLMEAYCYEYPEECSFCVFVYNVQDGVEIDYSTGESYEASIS